MTINPNSRPSLGIVLFISFLMGGCQMLAGQPSRLFSVAEETAIVRARVVTNEAAYYDPAVVHDEVMRNDIITSRMQAIDAYYYDYEVAILRERQEAGFISSLVNIGLTGAIPLVTSVGTKDILGGVSSALQGANKAFNDEILFQKTVQALQQQMRANRGQVATKIIDRMKRLTLAE